MPPLRWPRVRRSRWPTGCATRSARGPRQAGPTCAASPPWRAGWSATSRSDTTRPMDADFLDEMVPEATFKHHEEAIGAGRVVMALGGELDMFISPALAARFHELAEDGTHDVLVDLNDARFIDTHVLDTFVTAQEELQAHHRALAVVADSPYARRTIELTGLEETLRICRSRDEALALLS